MATNVLGVSDSHFRSVTVTSLASLAGVAAALASQAIATGPKDTTGVMLFAAFTLAQYPVLYAVGIDVEDFSAKDHLYVAFMTFAMWFVAWGILLEAGTTL